MTHKEYNGWFNYETWLVNLWIDSEEGFHLYWRDRAQEALDHAEADDLNTKEQRATYDLADTLKDEYEERAQEILEGAKATCSVWADLQRAALSEVNWQEIAEHMIRDAVENQPKEEA